MDNATATSPPRQRRTFADLLAIAESAPAWQPPEKPESAAAESGVAQGLDLFTDRQIVDALKIDVLGKTVDREIEAYSMHLKRTVRFSGVARLKYDDLLELFGTPVRRAVSRTNEDSIPGMYPIRDVREAIAHLASTKLLSDETKLGPGVWPVEDEAGGDHGDQRALVLVNQSEAMHYNGTIERITHPRHRGHLLSFESGVNPWYEHDQLVGLLDQAKNSAFRQKVADDLVNLFGRWRWKGSSDPLIAAGLVLATWVQTVWSWRPRIDVLGASNTGKSMLCVALAGVFKDIVIMTSDTTAAGLRQKICNSARVVIVDEVDAKNKAKIARQREILEMLRSASRGTSAIRGTGSGRAVEFTLRHLVWVAGISLSYDDQADRNRAVILNLLPPLQEMAGKLRLPSPDELADLGRRSLAVAVWAAQSAKEMTAGLKDQKIDGVDQRLVESYSVPASMIAAILGFDLSSAAGVLRTMLMDAKSDIPVESDEMTLIGEILGATVRLESHSLTVGQAIDIACDATQTNRDAWKTALEASGVRVDTRDTWTVTFQYQLIKKLLRGTRWADQPVEQYLRRIPNIEHVNIRVGGQRGRGVRIAMDRFRAEYMGQDESCQQVETGAF